MMEWWKIAAALGAGAVLGATFAGGDARAAYDDGHADGYAWGRYTAARGAPLDRAALGRSAARGGRSAWTARELLGGGS
ncbi:MAG: hypothetical protein U0324_46365 [Polyangiales bacterium]